MIVNVTVRFTGCTDRPGCTDDFVILHRYDTNSLNENERVNRHNYQYYLGNEQSSRLQQNPNGANTEIITRYSRPANYNYTYFGIQDTGTFGNIIRILVYYEVCPRRVGRLIVYPEIPRPVQGSTIPIRRTAQCVENAHNTTSLETFAHDDGRCVQTATCVCDVGYERVNEDQCTGMTLVVVYNITMVIHCLIFITACVAGEYRSAQNNSCVLCPRNSTSVFAERECDCIIDHYRAEHEGIGVDCTGKYYHTSLHI